MYYRWMLLNVILIASILTSLTNSISSDNDFLYSDIEAPPSPEEEEDLFALNQPDSSLSLNSLSSPTTDSSDYLLFDTQDTMNANDLLLSSLSSSSNDSNLDLFNLADCPSSESENYFHIPT